MSELTIFSPRTVAKTQPGKPYLTMNRKAGLISISSSAQSKHFGERTAFNFVYDKEKKQGYIVPSEEGFEFRLGKEKKGLAMNHTSLVKAFLDASGIAVDGKNGFKFLVASDPDAIGENGEQLYPLIYLK